MHAQRKIDMSCEQEFSEFLNANLYDRVTTSYKRYTDLEHQYKGIDVIASFDFDDGHIIKNAIIDEKTQTHYINKNLQTNAFEISSIQKGTRLTGWLLDNRLDTEYYLIVFPFSNKEWNKNNLRYFTKEDISQLDCILIKKDKIKDYLADNGYTHNQLIWDSKKIVNQNKRGVTKTNCKHFRYYYSPQLKEKPICLLIDKSILRELAEKRFFVYPGQVKTLK